MTKEALTLALECAERCEAIDGMYSWSATITAIKEDLAQLEQIQPSVYSNTHQPEQEPVAIVHRNEYNEYRLEPHDNFDIKSIPFNVDVPLFKAPQRTWVDLTDEQMWNAYTGGSDIINLDYAKSIVALFKEKNT